MRCELAVVITFVMFDRCRTIGLNCYGRQEVEVRRYHTAVLRAAIINVKFTTRQSTTTDSKFRTFETLFYVKI